MTKSEWEELERIFYIFMENPDKENAAELKDFLKYCSKLIKLKDYKKTKNIIRKI